MVFSAGLAVYAIETGALRDLAGDPTYVDEPLEDLDPADGWVRTGGMAHYPVVVTQTLPGSIFREEQTRYLFALMQPHDTETRAIRVLVRTERKPDPIVTYEYMTVRGWVGLARADQVPFGTEDIFGRRGYYFADELLVIEADAVEEGLAEPFKPEPVLDRVPDEAAPPAGEPDAP